MPSQTASPSSPAFARAVVYRQFGGPEVLELDTITVPAPGQGEVRIRMVAVGLNPVDFKIRRGGSRFTVTLPAVAGREFSGIIEAVGAGVSTFAAGDRVFGSVPDAAASELIIAPVDAVAPVPAEVDLEVAGGLALAGQTAWDALDSQGLQTGDTIVVSAAAGGVGGMLCQLAVARGLRVIGTASAANHDWLASKGVTPVLYGEGLVDRLRDAAGSTVSAVFDQHGLETIEAALELGVPAERINTIAISPPPLGVCNVGRGPVHAPTLSALAAHVAAGELEVPIAARYPLERVRDAFLELEAGHVRGKIILVP